MVDTMYTFSAITVLSPVARLALVAGISWLGAAPTLAQPAPTPPNVAPSFSPLATPSNTLAVESSYTLGPGDRVLITLFQAPEYSGENQVLVDGSLNLPVAGTVAVEGLTLPQAAAAISARYARYLRRPITTVSLIAPRPVRINISGEVSRPGSYAIPIQGGGSQGIQLPTLTEAIQLAGGVKPTANLRQVQIRRSDRRNPPQNLQINLWDMLQTGSADRSLSLRDGDMIHIPTAGDVNLGEIRQLSATNLYATSAQPVNVAIVGQVRRPGTYAIQRGGGAERSTPPTVTSAIQTAGGITEQASVRNIQIRRTTSNGTEKVIEIDLFKLLREGDLSQDTLLQEGDTLVIPTATASDAADAAQLAATSFSPATIKVYVVGEVVSPGAVDLPPNTPLNQALLAAGGFDNRRANRDEVDLIRLNPDGTAVRREIPVDFAQGIDETGNPALRNNDVIVVRRSGLAGFTDTARSVVEPLGTVFPFVNFLRLFGL